MKRSKNIFNSPIIHESLLQEEENRDFTIDNKNVDSNWLVGVNPQDYRRYIVSALSLTDLQKQLDDLREQEGKEITQSNIFKISKTKKRIDGLQLQQLDDQKPVQPTLAKNQPPQCQQLIAQKMSGGFFKSLLQRKCMIKEKQFYIESQKDQNLKWIGIEIQHYTLQLQDKEKPLNREEFKEFSWIGDYTQRVLIWASQKKGYCVYGKDDNLRKFQRYFQVENFEVKQLNVFKQLDAQLHQKIITLFGNKVRFYDHFIKIRKAEKDAQLSTFSPTKQNRQTDQKNIKTQVKQKLDRSDFEQSSQISHSGIFEPKNSKGNGKHDQRIEPSLINLEQKSIKRLFSGKQKDKKGESEIFKLNLGRSCVFYNQIQEPLDFDDKDGYSVADINLNLKEEVGMSEVDEESEYRSVGSSKIDKKRVVNLTVDGCDQSQKFKINVYEVSSVFDDKNDHQDGNKESSFLMASDHHSQRSLPLIQKFDDEQEDLKRTSSLKISQISVMLKTNKKHPNRQSSQIDSVMQYFQLQKARPQDDDSFDSIKSFHSKSKKSFNKTQKQNYLIKNFKKKRINQLEVILNQKPQETQYLVSQIQMMMPYHSENLHFQIIQLDPQLQMQNKIVACSFVDATMKEDKVNYERYMHYTCEGGIFFKMSKVSPFFVFVLQEDSKFHYIHFQLDPKPKYQQNYSQLLMTQLDGGGYPFAINLMLFASPTPITLQPPMTTIQFLKKYLTDQNYNFKHDFIDNKRRTQQIKQKWNKIQSKHAVNQVDADTFSRIIYLGVSKSVFKLLKKNVTYDPLKLFRFTESQARMIQDNVLTNFVDLKSFTKPTLFVNQIIKAEYNQHFRQRLEQVYVYFLNRYGSTRNLALIFIKVILDKLQPLLILCRRDEQISAVVKLYAEVEYQIDEVFLEISKYFKK